MGLILDVMLTFDMACFLAAYVPLGRAVAEHWRLSDYTRRRPGYGWNASQALNVAREVQARSLPTLQNLVQGGLVNAQCIGRGGLRQAATLNPVGQSLSC